jgi:hypothetical protein
VGSISNGDNTHQAILRKMNVKCDKMKTKEYETERVFQMWHVVIWMVNLIKFRGNLEILSNLFGFWCQIHAHADKYCHASSI